MRAAVVAVLLLAAVSCSSTSEPGAAADPSIAEADAAVSPTATETVASEPSERGSDVPPGSFCSRGNAFVTDTNLRLVAAPTAETFDGIYRQLDALVGEAPGDLLSSVMSLRSGFESIGDAYAATGFDPTATITLSPEVQDSNSVAVAELRGYLLTNCDLMAVQDEQIAEIQEAFGIEDPATAECIHAQLGDLANIDSSTLTPELMTVSVCGTSLLGLLSGESVDNG